MKNMCLDELWLVAPKKFPHAEATARASGADDILARARVVYSLDEALADCVLVLGTSARPRTIPWPRASPRESAILAIEYSGRGPVALLFGRERVGLTNDELERCHYWVQIPANPEYSSLNIAAAVQILTYELMLARGSRDSSANQGGHEHAPASADDIERLFEHLRVVLVEIGFLDPDNPRQLMRRLRRFFNRARPDTMELNILRGMLTAVQEQNSKRKD